MLSDKVNMLSEGPMATPVTVKVSSRHQVALPAAARRRLRIEAGDRLLVDVQDGLLILLPCPEDYATAMAGLHQEVWASLDTTAYLEGERDEWNSMGD